MLDPFALTAKHRRRFIDAYNAVAGKELKPLPEIDEDEDRAALDEAVSDALGIKGGLLPLRKAFAREPLISGHAEQQAPPVPTAAAEATARYKAKRKSN